MHRDFEISQGIYLVQGPHELDLHNNFNFLGFDYSVEHRSLLLRWRCSSGKWIASDTPATVTIEFRKVSEFHFQPRDPEKPFTEDDCMRSFGYWTDENWSEGVIIPAPSQEPDPKWSTAVDFMSGATLIVQAESACARIEM